MQILQSDIAGFEQVNAGWLAIFKCDKIQLKFNALFINPYAFQDS